MFKEQCQSHMVEIIYVRFLFLWMITKMLMWMPQTMQCIISCNSPILFCSLQVQAMKGLFVYNTTNGITTLKKHLNANHFIIAKLFKEAINSPLKWKVEKQLAKKRSYPSNNVIVNFLLPKILSRRIICSKHYFLKLWAC